MIWRGLDVDQGFIHISCLPGQPVTCGPACHSRRWSTGTRVGHRSIQQWNNIAWRLVPNQVHRVLTRSMSACLAPIWLDVFSPSFWMLVLVLSFEIYNYTKGRDLINFHSRPMLCSECSQYLGRYLDMGVDYFCWWLVFLWLVLCVIVLVAVWWQFSREICYSLIIVYFWYSVFWYTVYIEIVYTVYFGTVNTVYFGTAYRFWALYLVSCDWWSD